MSAGYVARSDRPRMGRWRIRDTPLSGEWRAEPRRRTDRRMEIDITTDVRIARPRPEVAAYMFDPRNDAAWTTGVIESHPRQEGRLAPGARVERIAKFLGRRFGYEYVVTAADGDRSVELSVSQPFPMRIRYELEDAPGGATVARIRARGEGTGFFSLSAPLLAPMVKRNISKDLELLRQRLEQR